jgi:hypothetical protein
VEAQIYRECLRFYPVVLGAGIVLVIAGDRALPPYSPPYSRKRRNGTRRSTRQNPPAAAALADGRDCAIDGADHDQPDSRAEDRSRIAFDGFHDIWRRMRALVCDRRIKRGKVDRQQKV